MRPQTEISNQADPEDTNAILLQEIKAATAQGKQRDLLSPSSKTRSQKKLTSSGKNRRLKTGEKSLDKDDSMTLE